jgi:outer membrane protein assembly factor BamB
MRQLLAWTSKLLIGVALLVATQTSKAVITRLTPLREVLASEQLILATKVEKLDSEKPAVVLQIEEDLKGKAPFRKLPIHLAADSEGQREKHTGKLLKRLAPELPVIVFASKRGKRYTAFGYTNGTWFQFIGQAGDEPATVRWSFTHCEPYLRRTFKGATAELQQIVVDGLAGTRKPPEPDPKEPPGLGPEVEQGHAPFSRGPAASAAATLAVGSRLNGGRGTLLAVIPSFTILGPLALLAALFPTVFGGLAVFMRRWLVLLTVASLNSTLYFAHGWFQGYLRDTWWGTPVALWSTMTVLTLAGIVWSGRRQRVLSLQNPDSAPPVSRRGEELLLGFCSFLGVGFAIYCLFLRPSLAQPWQELLILCSVPWVGTLYLAYLRVAAGNAQGADAPRSACGSPCSLGTEGVMLWTFALACVSIGALSVARPAAAAIGTLVWKFEPKEHGAIISSPAITEDRVFVAAIAGSGFSTYGVVYCLNRVTGEEVWRFDDDQAMQQVFSSPCLHAGRLYIGEGLHENRGCKFYCLDAATGHKLWEFETTSHTESSPCAADGKVFFGAGEDGIYCLNAATGTRLWHFQENLHVDASPKIVGNRLYAGSGVSRTQKETQVFCLDAETGGVLWRNTVELPVWGSPCVSGSRVFFGLGNGRYDESAKQPAGALLCVDADTGKETWCRAVDDAVLMTPTVNGEQVYFGSRDHHCYCLKQADGQLQWKTDMGSPVVARLIAGDNGIYVAASGGKVCRLGVGDGRPLWSFDVAAYAQSEVTLFASPASWSCPLEERQRYLYVGAGLKRAFASQAALYCLADFQPAP